MDNQRCIYKSTATSTQSDDLNPKKKKKIRWKKEKEKVNLALNLTLGHRPKIPKNVQKGAMVALITTQGLLYSDMFQIMILLSMKKNDIIICVQEVECNFFFS